MRAGRDVGRRTGHARSAHFIALLLRGGWGVFLFCRAAERGGASLLLPCRSAVRGAGCGVHSAPGRHRARAVLASGTQRPGRAGRCGACCTCGRQPTSKTCFPVTLAARYCFCQVVLHHARCFRRRSPRFVSEVGLGTRALSLSVWVSSLLNSTADACKQAHSLPLLLLGRCPTSRFLQSQTLCLSSPVAANMQPAVFSRAWTPACQDHETCLMQPSKPAALSSTSHARMHELAHPL